MATLKVTRVEVDAKGLGALQRNGAIIGLRENAATAILQAATSSIKHKGEPYPDYKMFSEPVGGGGWNVTVVTDSNHAKYSNAKHNTLTRVTGFAR